MNVSLVGTPTTEKNIDWRSTAVGVPTNCCWIEGMLLVRTPTTG